MKAMHELAKVRHLHLHESVVRRARPGLSNNGDENAVAGVCRGPS